MLENDIIAIVCPDIHGRTFWKKAAEIYDGTVPFIFLGDYLDSYSEEGITPRDAEKNFKELWEFKEKWDDKVIMLLGNHDLSYYDSDFMTVRYAVHTAKWYKDFLKENWKSFKFAHQIEHECKKYIFSHAGLHPEWFEQNQLEEIYDADYINGLWETNKMAFRKYSRFRGGKYYYTKGSPIWADIREYDKEFKPEGIIQIVGHTALSIDSIKVGCVNCIDSLQAFVITKEGDVKPL